MRSCQRSVSMAKLQGYLLLHKMNPSGAIENTHRLFESKHPTEQSYGAAHRLNDVELDELDRARRERRARRGALSPSEVDRMVFNPQVGWDKDL